ESVHRVSRRCAARQAYEKICLGKGRLCIPLCFLEPRQLQVDSRPPRRPLGRDGELSFRFCAPALRRERQTEREADRGQLRTELDGVNELFDRFRGEARSEEHTSELQ